MALKMKKVGPSARAKDAPLRQDLRLQFAPALELLVIGEEGIQVALPDGVEPTRLRSLLNAVSNRAGYTVSTELVWKTDKKGGYVMGEDGKRIPVAVNVYKTGTKEVVADEPEGEDDEPEAETPVAVPPRKAKEVVVPPVEDDDENFDPLGGDDEDDD